MHQEHHKHHISHKKENPIKRFWHFLSEDTWQAWIVSLVIIIICIKFILFPLLSLITGSSLPLVVVESCSMYHSTEFESWWNSNEGWYKDYKNISKKEFKDYHFKNGLNKGDIILTLSPKNVKKGDIVIFNPNAEAKSKYPIIHRIVSENPLETKGDNNNDQLRGYNNLANVDETNIQESQLVSRAAVRIPYLGWAKLIFFEPMKPADQRWACKP